MKASHETLIGIAAAGGVIILLWALSSKTSFANAFNAGAAAQAAADQTSQTATAPNNLTTTANPNANYTNYNIAPYQPEPLSIPASLVYAPANINVGGGCCPGCAPNGDNGVANSAAQFQSLIGLGGIAGSASDGEGV